MNEPTGPPPVTSIRWVARQLEARYGTPERRPSRTVLDGLIATLLSQNTTGTNARAAMATLRERFPSWSDVLAAPAEAVADAIRVAGLGETRAARIQAILARVLDEQGELGLEALREQDDETVGAYLRSLPGVGVKTAACVLLFDLDRAVFPVDTHVWRLARRLGWVPESAGRDETYARVAPRVPPPLRHALHVNLIRHGRLVCRPREPRCGDCVLLARCPTGRRLTGSSRT